MNQQPAPAKPESCDVLTVMFDGACPVCRREIGMYQSLTPQEPVAWLDVSKTSPNMTPAEQASYLARFHVRQKDGKVLSGAAAFVALWLTMPGWRWLGRFGRLPGVTPVLEVFYRGFLHLRPYLQRLANAADRAHLPDDTVADLRASHMCHAVVTAFHQGVVLATRNAQVKEFAQSHLKAGQHHLELLAELLPPLKRSILLPFCKAAGLVTGAIAALFGSRTVFATAAAVQTFADSHNQTQIDKLSHRPENAELLRTLVRCQSDQRESLTVVIQNQAVPQSAVLILWCKAIGVGLAAAVRMSKKL